LIKAGETKQMKSQGKRSAGKIGAFIPINVERIDLASFSRIPVRPKVVAADLGRRHKSDDFNSFLMHLFF
jgi:hypothetical protein